jgi:uncharacterized protein YlaI
MTTNDDINLKCRVCDSVTETNYVELKDELMHEDMNLFIENYICDDCVINSRFVK